MTKSPMRSTVYIPPKRRFRGRHIFIILLVFGIAFGAYRKVYRQRKVDHKPAAAAITAAPVENEALKKAAAEPLDKYEIRHVTVHSVESLPAELDSSGIPNAYLKEWQDVCKSVPLSQIKEDDELIFVLNRANGLPVKIIYSRSDGPSYTLRKGPNGWECGSGETAAREPARTVHGTCSGNFYDSCVAGGLPPQLISNLAELFSYDVDLTADLSDGDSFSVLFQEGPIQSGVGKQLLILGAEIVVSGKIYQAFGFQLPDGSWDYFDAKGSSVKRAFLRSPVSYRMLLASQNGKTVKPVSRTGRSRSGAGYTAPRGTAVVAVGDGVVSAVGRNGKKGFTVEIRHRGGYKSRYANLATLSRGVTRGAPVSQSEAIGSIGWSGSEKAYLDFRLLKDGKPVNLQTAEFSRSKVVPKAAVPDFEKSRDFCTSALRGETPDGRKSDIPPGKD